MSLITCPECGASVSDAAEACVKCGEPLMMRLPARKVDDGRKSATPGRGCLLLLLVPAIVAVGFVAIRTILSSKEPAFTAAPQRPPPDPAPPAVPAPAAQLSPADVSSEVLFNDYQANEVAADDKYKGKKLAVRGKVASIDKTYLGNIVVRLATPNPFMPVDAQLLDFEKADAARLAKGDVVTVLCQGGGLTLGRPQLTGCTLE